MALMVVGNRHEKNVQREKEKEKNKIKSITFQI